MLTFKNPNFDKNGSSYQCTIISDKKNSWIGSFTSGLLLRSGVDGLPSAVTVGQIGTAHPGLDPHVEIPNRIAAAVGIERVVIQLIVVGVVVSIDGQTGVGIVGRYDVGYGSCWNSQSPAHWNTNPQKFFFFK